MKADPNLKALYESWRQITDDGAAAATMTALQLTMGTAQAIEAAPIDDAPLKPADVAKLLHVSPHTVLEWIRTTQLKAANVATGRRPRYLIQRADMDRFLASRQPEPPLLRRRSA